MRAIDGGVRVVPLRALGLEALAVADEGEEPEEFRFVDEAFGHGDAAVEEFDLEIRLAQGLFDRQQVCARRLGGRRFGESDSPGSLPRGDSQNREEESGGKESEGDARDRAESRVGYRTGLTADPEAESNHEGERDRDRDDRGKNGAQRRLYGLTNGERLVNGLATGSHS